MLIETGVVSGIKTLYANIYMHLTKLFAVTI